MKPTVETDISVVKPVGGVAVVPATKQITTVLPAVVPEGSDTVTDVPEVTVWPVFDWMVLSAVIGIRRTNPRLTAPVGLYSSHSTESVNRWAAGSALPRFTNAMPFAVPWSQIISSSSS